MCEPSSFSPRKKNEQLMREFSLPGPRYVTMESNAGKEPCTLCGLVIGTLKTRQHVDTMCRESELAGETSYVVMTS